MKGGSGDMAAFEQLGWRRTLMRTGVHSPALVLWNVAAGGALKKQRPPARAGGRWRRCLTMTYFRRDGPDYHRRWRVSRSCSRWEGVVPRRYGRQTIREQRSGIR